VIEDGVLSGIVTMSDIASAIENNLPLSTPVSEVMTPEVEEIASDVKLFEVIRRFKEREIGRLIVVENKKPVGILTQSDVIRVFPSL
jgi:hypothetical protein